MSEEKMQNDQAFLAAVFSLKEVKRGDESDGDFLMRLYYHIWQAALQESEAGAAPFGYLDRQQLERWERLRGTKYAAAEIGYIGFSKEPFETDLTDCTVPVFLAPPSAQAIETAAITSYRTGVIDAIEP